MRRAPHPDTICLRRACRAAFSLHVDGKCPNVEGAFYRHAAGRKRATNSFTAAEVNLLGEVLRGLQRGASADLRPLAAKNQPVLANLHRKALTMKARLAKASEV